MLKLISLVLLTSKPQSYAQQVKLYTKPLYCLYKVGLQKTKLL